MKKWLILGMMLLSTTGAMAYSGDCIGGEKITCVNGTYCLSNFTMTWWSAHSWCQSNGGTLITLQDLEDATTRDYTNCADVGKSVNVWTANPNGSTYVFYVALASGSHHYNHRSSDLGYALCK